MVKLGRSALAAAAIAFGALAATAASAQSTLDRVVQSKQLRCGVMLDFPPAGFRNQQNQPDGFDVAYCRDMAAALGATAEIVETPSPERIPALVSGRIDVLIASTSATPQRALTVDFTIPYVNYVNVVLTREDAGVASFEDMKGRAIGGVTGTTPEQHLLAAYNAWADPAGSYTGYGSDAESFLALAQGKIDGLIVANATAAALVQSGQFPTFRIAGEAPTPPDLCAIAVPKGDDAFRRWVNLFIWNQVVSGRYAELYATYFGEGEPPALVYPGVYY